MAQSKVGKIALSECRIRKLLSGDQGKATIGSGCIVTLNLGSEASNPKPGVFLITTTQVIAKNDLLSPSTSIVVELLDGGNGELLTFNLGFKYATETPDPIPGRVLEGTGDALKEVSFLAIPVNKFDNRNWFQRKYSSFRGYSFEKRSLACSFESDEKLRLALSRRKVFCHVLCDGRTNGSFNAEPYCLEFANLDSNEFALTSPLDHDGVDDIKQLKDFHKEEKPRGAPLLDAEGKFVGMLAVAPSQERKLFPLFLSTMEQDSSTPHTRMIRDKDDLNTRVVLSSEITVKPETSVTAASGSDQAAGNESSRQEESSKSPANNNQNCTHQIDNAENNCSTSVVQGSSNPVASPLQLDRTSNDTTPGELCLEENQLSHTPPEPQLPSTDEQDVTEHDPSSDSSLEEVDGDDCNGQMDSLSNLNEDVHHLQIADQRIRPNLLTQNSYYDEPPEIKDEEGYPYPVHETATPKPFVEPTADLSSSPGNRSGLESITDVESVNLRRSHSDIFSSSVSSHATRPMTRSNTAPGELEPVSPGCLVKDKIVSKVKVMDVLSLHLDRSVCPGSKDMPLTQRWEHLADEFNVPDEKKRQCENFTGNLSPSENMLEYLCVTHDLLPIKTLKDHLRELGRKDVVADLDNNRDLPDEATVTDLEQHPETMNVVCLKLDDKRGPVNWHDVGIKLGIPYGTLRTFKDPSGYSPSKVILKKIETLHPDLRIMTMEAALEEINLPAIARALNVLLGVWNT